MRKTDLANPLFEVGRQLWRMSGESAADTSARSAADASIGKRVVAKAPRNSWRRNPLRFIYDLPFSGIDIQFTYFSRQCIPTQTQ
jgi:hypothetical protein